MCLPVRYMRKIDPHALDKLRAAEKRRDGKTQKTKPKPRPHNTNK